MIFFTMEEVVYACTVTEYREIHVYVSLCCALTEEPDMEYRVLPWTADHQAIKTWLIDQGYGNCADKLSLQVKVGQTLYAMEREALREMFGSADGVRLYSQLQKDKPKSEKAAGVVKETDFQVYIGSNPFRCM